MVQQAVSKVPLSAGLGETESRCGYGRDGHTFRRQAHAMHLWVQAKGLMWLNTKYMICVCAHQAME